MRFVCRKLNIRTTVNEFIWRDIEDEKYGIWVRAVSKSCDFDIFGRLVLIEEFQRFPMIVVDEYEYTKIDETPVEDFSKDDCRRILIDTSKCDTVRLIYNEKSDNIKEYRSIV